MKKSFLIIFGFILGSMILLAGCSESTAEGSETQQTSPNQKTLGAVSYSLGDLKDVNVNITFANAQSYWTAEVLEGQAKECGTQQPLKYYQDLLTNFTNANLSVYHFTPKANPKEAYEMMILSNGAGYKSLESFKKDFDLCAAGGMYPAKVSEKWLLFTGSCGGAAPDVKPAVSCSDVQKVVEPSLKLVE